MWYVITSTRAPVPFERRTISPTSSRHSFTNAGRWRSANAYTPSAGG
jgi:hypothetical protein